MTKPTQKVCFDEYLVVTQNINTLNFIDIKESFPTKELSRQVEKTGLTEMARSFIVRTKETRYCS